MSAERETTIRTRDRATDVAAVAGLLVVVAFQLSLALGAPFGRAALGGTHEGQRPTDLRVVSVFVAAVWVLAAVVVMRACWSASHAASEPASSASGLDRGRCPSLGGVAELRFAKSLGTFHVGAFLPDPGRALRSDRSQRLRYIVITVDGATKRYRRYPLLVRAIPFGP